MFDATTSVLVYALGVAAGLALTDAPPASRLGLALLWPLGPVAFVVTLAMLVAASVIAFPVIAALMVASALAWFAFA